ncbi:MAG: metalloregulator ArsR/SmtB family transcription factor [Thermodesulfobacteriota bacterium]
MNIVNKLKSISDETRLRLLHLLQHHELNVNEVVTVMEMIQSRVSRHLKILVASGLLQSRRDGGFVYYSGAVNDENALLTALVRQSLENEPVCRNDLDRAAALIRERQTRTKRFFESVAATWEDRKSEVLGDLDLNRIIAEKIGKPAVVADLGCGTGSLMLALKQRAETIIGVDSSPGMLEQARLRTGTVPGINLRLGELEYLPMRDREADAAVMNMVLHHVSEPVKVLAEANRILKEGGLFIVADFDKHAKEAVREKIGGAWYGFSRREMEGWLAGAGFSPDGLERFSVNYGLTVNVFLAVKRA